MSELTPQQQILVALRSATEKIHLLEAARSEPAAVIGMACRFPGGANTPEQYWENLRNNAFGVSEVPFDRWDINAYYDPDPNVPGKMATRFGGFLQSRDVRTFDAGFFGISTKEAQTLDPQQRLVLECVWEALEDAGFRPESLSGTRTGVFLGISTSDYALLGQTGLANIDPYSGTGTAHSAAAGRVSYVYGFQGPSMAVDTACSSSLYALHIAVSALRNGECDVAVVAGVNLLLSPAPTIYFSKGRFMAPDGRCKTFDASADGYVRGEGCGVVILKRQSDAERDGDRIRALIRSTAVNQDGRSGGLTVPNGPAQEALIRDALARAGVKASDVDYVEAHGTGTQLGDPIEVNALANVYAEGRSAFTPLLIGSVKTNIGHLEAAAGMAGLIKLLLSLEHEEIPGQLHLQQPNGKIAWAEIPVSVVTQAVAWKRGKKKRIAGASAFAFQGSNAHVIIEEAPEPKAAAHEVTKQARPFELLSLSAKTEEALLLQANRWMEYLSNTTNTLLDVVYTALRYRTQFDHRLAVVAKDCKSAAASLSMHLRGESPSSVFVSAGKDHPSSNVPVEALLATQRSSLGTEQDWLSALTQLAAAYARREIDLRDSALMKETSGRRVDVPSYVFDRKRHWFSSDGMSEAQPSTAFALPTGVTLKTLLSSGADDQLIMQRLLMLVRQVVEESPTRFDENTDLFAAGIDSLAFMQLILLIQRDADITIRASKELADLRTASAFARLIKDLSSGAAPKSEGERAAPTASVGSRFLCNETDLDDLETIFVGGKRWLIQNGERAMDIVTVGQGRPLLFLPPLGCELVVWARLVELLRATHECVLVNFPGFGQTRSTPDIVDVDELTDFVFDAVNALKGGDPIDLLGWSLGGFVAQTIAARSPKRVRSLSLVNTTHRLWDEEAQAEGPLRLSQLLNSDLEHELATVDSSQAAKMKHLVDYHREIRTLQPFVQQSVMVARFDGRHFKFDGLSCLMVGGERDLPVPPTHTYALHQSHPGSMSVVLPRAGHYIPLFRAAEFAGLLRATTLK